MRILALDVAKGIGILLVVFGHAWRGASDAGLAISEEVFRLVDSAIYAFHMPLFFFLAALLFLNTLAKPLPLLVTNRVTRLLWPMALWTWIFFGIKVAVGDLQNEPVSLSEFPIVPLPPYAHLWFLWALFLIQTLLILLFKSLPQGWLQAAAFRAIMGASALALGLSMPWIHLHSQIFGAAVHHLPYFLAGLACTGLLRMRPALWVALPALAGALVLIGLAAVPHPPIPLVIAILLLLWLAIAGFCTIAGPRPGTALAVLGLLGTLSMPIYLVHTIFSAGLREVLIIGGVTNVPLHLAAGTAVGVVGPILAYWAATRAGMLRALGF